MDAIDELVEVAVAVAAPEEAAAGPAMTLNRRLKSERVREGERVRSGAVEPKVKRATANSRPYSTRKRTMGLTRVIWLLDGHSQSDGVKKVELECL